MNFDIFASPIKNPPKREEPCRINPFVLAFFAGSLFWIVVIGVVVA